MASAIENADPCPAFWALSINPGEVTSRQFEAVGRGCKLDRENERLSKYRALSDQEKLDKLRREYDESKPMKPGFIFRNDIAGFYGDFVIEEMIMHDLEMAGTPRTTFSELPQDKKDRRVETHRDTIVDKEYKRLRGLMAQRRIQAFEKMSEEKRVLELYNYEPTKKGDCKRYPLSLSSFDKAVLAPEDRAKIISLLAQAESRGFYGYLPNRTFWKKLAV